MTNDRGTFDRSMYEDDFPDIPDGASKDFSAEEHCMRVTATSERGGETAERKNMRTAKVYTVENVTEADFQLVERDAVARGDRTLARFVNRASVGNLLPYAKQRVVDILNARSTGA